MMDLYVMRHANGDWFAIEDNGRLRVPVFHSTHDAFMARLRTAEMLLFSPIALDARLLNEIADGPTGMDFCLIDNPFASLKRGSPLRHAELASLMIGGAPQPGWKWLSRPWS